MRLRNRCTPWRNGSASASMRPDSRRSLISGDALGHAMQDDDDWADDDWADDDTPTYEQVLADHQAYTDLPTPT